MSGATGKDEVRLLEAHVRDLARSGITLEQALAAGMRSLTAEEVSARIGFPISSGGYLIPYPGTDAFRIRLDEPHPLPKGKRAKYLAPIGSKNRLYIPPHCRRALEEDPERRVIFTEGEKKSYALTLHTGEIVIGVPGVWNWSAKEEPDGVIRDLVEVEPLLRKREVVVAFDSDARENVDVAKAAGALSERLAEKARARVLWAFPLPAPDGSKQGVDDLLVAEGVGAVADLLDGAFPPVDPIAYLLRERLKRVGEDEKREFVGGPLFRELAGLLRQARRSIRGALCEEVRRSLGLSIQDRTSLRDEVLDFAERVSADGAYEATRDGMIWNKPTRDGSMPVFLTNFTARIAGDVLKDDGAERTRHLELEVELRERKLTFTVLAASFPLMTWVAEQVGPKAILHAGFGVRDHARVAIQILSRDIVHRSIYTHTGWRLVEKQWVYLHAGGAIGGAGAVENVDVELPEQLRGFVLPVPPNGEDLRKAVRASIAFLDVAPDRLTIPLYAAIWRAPLPGVPPSVFIFGKTGERKTAIVAVAQQHYGRELDAENLPGNWLSTANAREEMAFLLKDALQVVDDYVPGAGNDGRLQSAADRLLRGQANRQGRHRMRADGSLRPPRPPRGLPVGTGEDVPRGASVGARVVFLEVVTGDVDLVRLTQLQKAAGDGSLAAAMAGYLMWLAPRLDELRARIKAREQETRDRLAPLAKHGRTPGNLASLSVGLEVFLEFARDAGAIDAREADALRERVDAAVLASIDHQNIHQEWTDPGTAFLQLIASAIGGKRAHVAGMDGNAPPQPESWGWSPVTEGGEIRPAGPRIGWVDGEDLFLETSAAFAVARSLARDVGEDLPVSRLALRKLLFEAGKLASVEVRGGRRRFEVRQVVEGRRRGVLHLRASLPWEEVAQVAHSPESPAESEMDVGHSPGHPGPSVVDVSPAGGPRDGAPETDGPHGPLFGRGERAEAQGEPGADDDEVEI